MKSKSIILFFVFAVVFLAVIFAISHQISKTENKNISRAKIINPASQTNQEEGSEKKSSGIDSEQYETLVTLLPGETLISTLTIDFSNDGYDDQVIVVRKNTSQNLFLVPGLYDSESGNYTRLAEIPTKFSRSRAFSYSGMDLIGDHKESLIYQGIDDSGNYVMEVFLFNDSKTNPELLNIGDFYSDGTIFIQQTERSESYEFSLSKGESYSIWVYKSEKQEAAGDSGKPAVANQIQQEYKWNAASKKYELAREIKVNAGRLAANELSKIQDGTVETFASFLNGLWYKVSNSDSKIRYVFFDYASKEIILLYGDIQEVYEWEDSKLRHNGIYLTTINADIMNFHRRFDLALTGVDEIKITIRDDVNLIIKENTMWDGNYKKMSQQSDFFDNSQVSPLKKFSDELKKNSAWSSVDSPLTISFDDFTYTLQNSSVTESGVYVLSRVGAYNVIQFRSDSDSTMLNDAYSMEFGTKLVTETVNKKTIEKKITDYDSLILTPVKISPTDCFATEGKIYTFSR